ncbi:hypothetical protein RUND412_001551 [Rhizina undulata]
MSRLTRKASNLDTRHLLLNTQYLLPTTLLARPYTATSSAAPTISQAIKEDHDDLRDYYHQMLNATTDDVRRRWQNQFSWELARHAIGEEIVLYPAYEKYVGWEGQRIADHNRDLHQRTKDDLEYFQRVYPNSPEFIPKLDELMAAFSEHMEAEENEELPKLEKALAGHEGVTYELAGSFKRTKMFAPTRSHPWMPNKPPFETVVSLMAAPYDMLVDMFRKFPKEGEDVRKSE